MAASIAGPRAVLVDLDGTMVDSAPDIAVAANCMLAELGAAPLPLASVRGFIGRGVANLVRQVLAATPALAAVDEATALTLFEGHYVACNGRHSTLFPGVLDGLRLLRELGYPLACVTNKPRAFTGPLLDALGLSSCLDAVLCADAAMPLKPDPALLIAACRRFHARPADCVMVGDSAVDAAAAARAGMPVYLVRYGYPGVAGPGGLRCDGYLDEIGDLAAFLGHGASGLSAAG